MQQSTPRNTVYRQFVIQKLCDLHEQGRAFFTLKEFADFAQLKVTGNLRRQFKSFVAERSLIPMWVYHGAYGNQTVYQFADLQMELPICLQPTL